MKNTLTFSTAAVAALALTGCMAGLHSDGGSGVTASQSLDLKGFQTITLNGSAELVVTVGPEESIKVEGDEQRVKNFVTELKGKELVLGEKSQGLFGSKGDLKVTVTLPTLEGITVNGSGTATVTGVKSDAFAATVNGSGELAVTGEVGSFACAVNGSGEVIADALKSNTTSASIAGSGNINTATSNTLTVNISGSGDLKYFGDPKVTKSIVGSGDIVKG